MKKLDNKELIDIAAELEAVTSRGRSAQANNIKAKLNKLRLPLSNNQIKYPVSIINLQSHDIRIADHYASNVISVPARQEVRILVTNEQMQVLDREQTRGTLNYKVLHPVNGGTIPPNVNLRCPSCTGTVDYFTGACKCGHKLNIPPSMQ